VTSPVENLSIEKVIQLGMQFGRLKVCEIAEECHEDQKTVDIENENVEISTILSTISTLVDNNAETVKISGLNLRLFWNNDLAK
jgi:hypothetical protein